MRFELILISNALSGQSNEFELTPDSLHYAIPQEVWRKWSQSIRERALREFLKGNKPFLKVHQVSADRLTLHHKPSVTIAAKPGTRLRKRLRVTSS